MVDMIDSKSIVREGVRVRVPLRALYLYDFGPMNLSMASTELRFATEVVHL
jgi:hypothetical protein